QAQSMESGRAAADSGSASIASIVPASLNTDEARAAAATLQDKLYVDALSRARAALLRDKSSAALHQIAALALAGMGQADQAVDEAVEAARTAPDGIAAYATFVDMFSSPQSALKGVGYGSRMQRVNPALGSWAMGRLAQISGDFELALHCYQN